MTPEGEKLGKGEPFCKHFPKSLVKLVETKKEEDKHAMLLLWFYFNIYRITGKKPQKEHFQKNTTEFTAYPNIRKEVGKTIMYLLSSCLENDKKQIQEFFQRWDNILK